MSKLYIEEFDSKSSHHLFIVLTVEKVHQVVKSWKNSEILLEPNSEYKFILINLTKLSISSATVQSSTLPYDSFDLPLHFDSENDRFDVNFKSKPDCSLKVSVQPLDDQPITINIDYEIDDEPLIPMSCKNSQHSSEYPSDNIMSDAYCAKIENFKNLLEKEEKFRKIAEDKLSNLYRQHQTYVESSFKTEDSLRKNIEELEVERNENIRHIQKLEQKLKKSYFQIQRLEEKSKLSELKESISDYQNLKEELEMFKKLYEKSERMIQETIEKFENSNENDPISLLLKEKDEIISKQSKEISNLNNEVNSLLSKLSEFEDRYLPETLLEEKLKQSNITYKKENELVFTINGTKLVISLLKGSLIMNKISGFYNFEEPLKTPQHKRSSTEVKSSFKKRSSVKLFQVPKVQL